MLVTPSFLETDTYVSSWQSQKSYTVNIPTHRFRYKDCFRKIYSPVLALKFLISLPEYPPPLIH
jgi:hypothetical protein